MLSSDKLNTRYLVELAYNGEGFHGWQIQPNALTVQEAVNQGLSTLLKEDINVVGAGRTDTGVHASHFVAHFNCLNSEIDCEHLVYKLNRYFTGSIRIDRIIPITSEFHARFSATARTYHYLISRFHQPFMRGLIWNFNRELNVNSMNTAASKLLQYDDFTSFARLHTETKTNTCKIREAKWIEHESLYVFKICADRFLRNMVRAVVGSLVEIGLGKMSVDQFIDIIEIQNRSKAGQSAPAEGLFLTQIDYPAELFQAQPRQPFSLFH